VPEALPQVVDVVFDVEGTSLPADYAWLLLQAIESRLPWFGGDAIAGVHPLRAAATERGVVLLARRSKLVLRAPAARLADCLVLQDAELDVGGNRLRVGGGRSRALRPSATLSALRVAVVAVDARGRVSVDGVAVRPADAVAALGRRADAVGRENESGFPVSKLHVVLAGSRVATELGAFDCPVPVAIRAIEIAAAELWPPNRLRCADCQQYFVAPIADARRMYVACPHCHNPMLNPRWNSA